MADPEWETSKENVAPLRAGRDVSVLNKALTTSNDQRELQRLTREEQVRDAIAGHGPYKDDPLEAWSGYTKWIVENYPSGSELLIRAVEEVCRMYAKSDRYRDDIRLVRLWIRYIDLRQDKIDAFNYMNRRKIGQSWSLFYEAWAITLEIARQYDEAETVYRTGRERQAKPVERLAQREREYYKRMAARRRRDEKKKLDAETKRITQSHREEARKVRESSRAASSLANSVLSETGTDERSTHDARVQKVRPALGQINEAQAKSGRRPFVLERNHSRVGTTGKSLSQRENHNPKPQKFEIYADHDINTSPVMTGMPHSLNTTEEDIQPIPELVKRDDLRKEDEGRLPSKWSGQTLPQENTLRSKLKRGSSRPFEVYQDPDSLSSPSDPIVEAAIRDVRESRSEQVDSFDDVLQRSSVPRKTAARANASSWLRDTTDGSGSPTINTKLAMKEVDDIFNSSHPMDMESDLDVLGRNPVVHSFRGKALKGGTTETRDYVHHETEKGSSLVQYSRPEMVSRADEHQRKENRNLQPLSEFEGSSVHSIREAERENDAAYKTSLLDIPQKPRPQKGASSQLQDSKEYDMTEFLASWCNNDSQFQLLEDPDPEVAADEMFDLQCRQGPVSFNVDKFQWAGYCGHSYVVLADDLNNSFGLMDASQETGSEDDDFKVVAIKVSRSSNAWEYYIYKTIHSRLSSTSSSIPQAISFCEGNPGSYLILDSYSNCSLREAENHLGKKFPESLSMFFTVSILRVLEDLHGIDIIHSDVTLDNVLFRYDLNSDISKHLYSGSGEAGWSRWGVLLVDYNQTIDARHPQVSHMDTISLAEHVAKQGNSFLQEEYRIPNAQSWAYNGDCFSASMCAARMVGICGSDFRNHLSGLQHASIWENFFLKMEELHASSTARQTCDAMRSCRIEMEEALRADRMLAISLMQLVTHIVDADNEDMTKGF